MDHVGEDYWQSMVIATTSLACNYASLSFHDKLINVCTYRV
jgi:hypothetical protein